MSKPKAPSRSFWPRELSAVGMLDSQSLRSLLWHSPGACGAARWPWRRAAFRLQPTFASSSPRPGQNGLTVPKVSDAGTPGRSPCLPERAKQYGTRRDNHNTARPPAPSRHRPCQHLPCPYNPNAETTICPSPGSWSTAGRNEMFDSTGWPSPAFGRLNLLSQSGVGVRRAPVATYCFRISREREATV